MSICIIFLSILFLYDAWSLLCCDYYDTVAIIKYYIMAIITPWPFIHMAIITVAIIISWLLFYTVAIIMSWLLLHRGYYFCGCYSCGYYGMEGIQSIQRAYISYPKDSRRRKSSFILKARTLSEPLPFINPTLSLILPFSYFSFWHYLLDLDLESLLLDM